MHGLGILQPALALDLAMDLHRLKLEAKKESKTHDEVIENDSRLGREPVPMAADKEHERLLIVFGKIAAIALKWVSRKHGEEIEDYAARAVEWMSRELETHRTMVMSRDNHDANRHDATEELRKLVDELRKALEAQMEKTKGSVRRHQECMVQRDKAVEEKKSAVLALDAQVASTQTAVKSHQECVQQCDHFRKTMGLLDEARKENQETLVAVVEQINFGCVQRPGEDFHSFAKRVAETARRLITGARADKTTMGRSVADLDAENIRLRRQLDEAYDRAVSQDTSIGILETQLKDALERAELSDEERDHLSWGS